jgi:hypothetical protein
MTNEIQGNKPINDERVATIDQKLEAVVIPAPLSTAQKTFTPSWDGGWTPIFDLITASASSSSRHLVQRALSSSATKSHPRRLARLKAFTWLFRILRGCAASSKHSAPVSQKYFISGRRALNFSPMEQVTGSAGGNPIMPVTALSPLSATRMATVGFCRRSRSGCLVESRTP